MLSNIHYNLVPLKRDLALFGLLLAGFAPVPVIGADQPSSSPVLAATERPPWLTDLSFGLKESYDSDVYLSGADHRFLPASYVVVPGGVAALKNRDSWVTTVSPKIGVNFVPLLGASNALQVLSIGYAPEFAEYHNERTEDYTAHRLAATAKGQAGDFLQPGERLQLH